MRMGPELDAPDDVELRPEVLGVVYERALDRGHRRRHGVHFTPWLVARKLAAIGLERHRGAPTVCDPSVGGGAFLLAAAEELAARGLDRITIVRELLWGNDVDPAAVEVTRAALALWASTAESGWISPGAHLVVADTLAVGAEAFAGSPQFDLVIGNPPFQGQLGSATARTAAATAGLRARWRVDAGPYADTSAYFLLAGLELAAPAGSVVLVQPQSLLAGADVATIREKVHASLVGLWVTSEQVFDANVRVCAPVLVRSDAATEAATAGASASQQVVRWTGIRVEEAGTAVVAAGVRSWSPLVSDLLGVPAVEVRGASVIGDIATATAGFRDQFYGLAEHTVEAEPGADMVALVTVGMIDPLHNRWGTGAFRFAGNRWTTPCVDLRSLTRASPTLAGWVENLRVPKLLVATQTKVIEVVVDEAGDQVPSTPTIAVVAAPNLLWKLAAALTSPAVTALALGRVAGTGLAAGTIKLSARQVLDLPLPSNEEAWERGARLAEAASVATSADTWRRALRALGAAMGEAYELDQHGAELEDWWWDRCPTWR